MLGKLTVSELVNKFPMFYGSQRLISMFTRACHLSLSSGRSIHSTTIHPVSLWSILTLFSDLHLGLPSGLDVTSPYIIQSKFLANNCHQYLTMVHISLIRCHSIACQDICSLSNCIWCSYMKPTFRTLPNGKCLHLSNSVNNNSSTNDNGKVCYISTKMLRK